MFMPDMPLFCIKNCGCRHPERAHCLSCHKNSEKFKIQERSEMHCCASSEKELEFLLVIDFECTCDEEKRLSIQEIIEFPIVVIDLKQLQIIDRFHSFVKPVVHPKLTGFCTKLTGITQEQVDSAPILQEVLKDVDRFLEKYVKDGLSRVSVLNDCDSDIRNFLRKETTFKEIPIKPAFKEFIDLRRIFPVKICEKPTNIDHMLACVGLQFEGVKHSGIDDATNIARVALEIAKRGYVYTDRLKEHMFPYSNPHYYEHLVIIATQPKMKNNVELGMIAHDLRKGTTLWNNFGRKNVKKQEMKKELFDFLDKVGIDVDNSIICVQGKLENEVRQFFQSADFQETEPIHKDESQMISSFLPFPLQRSSKRSNSPKLIDSISTCEISNQLKQSTMNTQQESNQYRHNYFTTYFSLNKISKLAGVSVAPNPLLQNHFPMLYQQKYYQNRTFNSFAQNPSTMTTFNNQTYANSIKSFQEAHDTHFQKIWNGVKDTNSSVVNRLTSMCNVVEGALQNGFIFSKDFASTASLKKGVPKMQ